MLQELTRTAVKAPVSNKDLVEQYNRLAKMVDATPVTRFASREVALKRLERIQAEVKARFVTTPERKKRQKVFNYPPRDELKALKPGTLRAEARDLLKAGATLGKVEELIADWDKRNGDKPYRLEPRAYGLVRLLHTYIGYALREEGEGDNKIIFLMDTKEWNAWRAQRTA